MRRFLALFLLALYAASAQAAGRARHVVLVVWDGMRPDLVSEQNTPALWRLRREGVFFQNHHSVYPSATEVNGTALATGMHPAHSGLVGNKEFRPAINDRAFIHTEAIEAVRRGDALSADHYLLTPTVPEIVRAGGGRTAVAGAKAVALLFDRSDRADGDLGANLFAGRTLPPVLAELLTNRYGAYPSLGATNPSCSDWTTLAMLDSLWADGVPEFSFLWLNEPDLTQHRTGPGSPPSLAAIRDADDNLARVLHRLEDKGLRADTDVIVASDHGCSTVSRMIDLAALLRAAGFNARGEFKTAPGTGDIVVAGNSGSSLLYVVGHDEQVIAKLVGFFQSADFTGVIFTREPAPGTFPLDLVHLNSAAPPDVVVSFSWTADRNTNGVPGTLVSDISEYGPGQGAHVSLSPFDMHNTLIAAGPDFRAAISDVLPSGNIDIAPTILWILGRKPPKTMDGRVLSEALTISGPKLNAYEPRHLEAGTPSWHQYLNYTEVKGVRYIDEGNGHAQ